MKLDELPLPNPEFRLKVTTTKYDSPWMMTTATENTGIAYTADQMRAAMRAGALAALDEAAKRVEDEMVDGKLGTDDYAYNAAIRHSLEAIRRLRDTIAEGESE